MTFLRRIGLAVALVGALTGPAHADLLRQLLLNGTVPSWLPLVAGQTPSKYEDYAAGHYWYGGRQYGSYTAFAAAVSANFSRASAASFTNASGAYASAGSNVLRFDDPGGVAQGLLLEGATTNGIRNSTMQGAGGGSAPTDWQAMTVNGVTPVFGTPFTANGINWVPVTFSGTASAGGTTKMFAFEQSAQIAAAKNQVWALSVFLYASGSIPVIALDISERGTGGTALLDHVTSVSPTTTPLRYTTGGVTLSNASTMFVQPWTQETLTNGATYGGTLYIGWPQAEQGSSASSPILTSGSAATRAADALSNPWTVGSALTKLVKIVTPPGFAASNMVAWAADDGTTSNAFQLLYNAATGHLNLAVVSGGTTQATLDLGTGSASTTYAVAFAAQANSFRASVNGGAVVSASSGAMPVGIATERYGAGQAGSQWGGHVEEGISYPAFANDNAIIGLAANP